MAMGKRKQESQRDLFLLAEQLPKSHGHVFYKKLNELLAAAGFDAWVENLCEPFYAQGTGRPGVPPGVYYRMLLVGYFEGIQTQRGIAWRCHDSLSLREFLGLPLTENAPDHSSLSYIRERLPEENHQAVFEWVLKIAADKKLFTAKSVGVDSSTLEANAAMKSIIRRDNGEDWKTYITRLMREAGVIDAATTPSEEDLRRFDKSRENKRVSNDEWISNTDHESRITKMKNGTTHLAYKAEHVVDLDSGMLLAAEIYAGDAADSQTLEDSVNEAQTHLANIESAQRIENVAADKGYHANETLTEIAEHTPYRTYIPEPKIKPKKNGQKGHRTWTDKPPEQQQACYANRRRVRGEHGKKLQRLRSEKVERSFAHLLETGGARRTWLRGHKKVRKRYSIVAAAYNLGVMMRKLFGIGTPRGLQKFQTTLEEVLRKVRCADFFTGISCWRYASATIVPRATPSAPEKIREEKIFLALAG
jgi:transposase